MTLRVLIVDDERLARVKVARFLESDDRFRVVGEACNGVQALERIEELEPDLVVLDIQMPGLDGFEVLDAFGGEAPFTVIFSTAYDRYALDAFNAHAVDYLLKPYDRERFNRALQKAFDQRTVAVRRHAALVEGALGETRSKLVVKEVEGPWHALHLSRVHRLSAANKYARVVVDGREILVRRPLSELAKLLDDRFVRVQRGEVVRIGAVVRLEPRGHGDATLHLVDGSRVSLSRTFRQGFEALWRSEDKQGLAVKP
ncbi:MAG: response regulator transcription factor [Myxococcales bacterium]